MCPLAAPPPEPVAGAKLAARPDGSHWDAINACQRAYAAGRVVSNDSKNSQARGSE